MLVIKQALTQHGLADLAGTDARTISELEKGYRGGYPSTVKRLCKALGVTPSELMAKDHSADQEQTYLKLPLECV
jgi:transcriptional regulator with XRE-family HTH domain